MRTVAGPLVDDALDAMDHVKGTTWEDTTWWPTDVVVSYARTDEQRARIEANIGGFSPPMGLLTHGFGLFKAVWGAPEDFLRLDGLSRVVGMSGSYCLG